MMNLPSTFKISLRALRVNKMRSALTMLGIIIGVAAVITMIAIGKGTSDKLSKEIATVGSNIIYIRPGSSIAGGVRGGMGTEMTLTRDDAEAIERECSAVLLTAPIISGVAQIVYSNQNWATSVQGTTAGMLGARDWTLYDGRNFTEQDIRNATKVCILGQTVVENLFGGMNPLNQTVRIKKVPFTIIGILNGKGQSMMGHDQDDIIFIPITTSQKRIFGTTLPGIVHTILVKAKSSEDLSRAESQINELLRQRHHIRPNQENDFTVRNLTQMLELVESTAKAMALLLAAIASISLLVGGIGIMNIMLVSVTERTREIGIRMAVGAKTWDIRMQFIIEAITLSIIGGIIGIILGIIASKLLSAFVNLTTIISPFAVMLAVGFSGLVGIFFGFYPAYKASLLNPIDALRYE